MDLDWQIASDHLRDTVFAYVELIGEPGVNVTFALARVHKPLVKRFLAGERTDELYQEIMSLS